MTRATHLDANGHARMVDVGGKEITARVAVSEGRITMNKEALAAIADGQVAKGDVLAAARIAGIMAGKRTHELIPLCHPLPLDSIAVDCFVEQGSVRVRCEARTTGRTGVEMEALTSASVALLTIYDMAKALDRSMRIEDVRLVSKRGGKSGDWEAD